MRAEILVPQAVRGRLAAERLYSYHVPETLISTVRVGHLVAIPFGERTTAGIIWALDASDDLTGSRFASAAHHAAAFDHAPAAGRPAALNDPSRAGRVDRRLLRHATRQRRPPDAATGADEQYARGVAAR